MLINFIPFQYIKHFIKKRKEIKKNVLSINIYKNKYINKYTFFTLSCISSIRNVGLLV